MARTVVHVMSLSRSTERLDLVCDSRSRRARDSSTSGGPCPMSQVASLDENPTAAPVTTPPPARSALLSASLQRVYGPDSVLASQALWKAHSDAGFTGLSATKPAVK